MFFVLQFGARFSNSFIVISNFFISFVNSKRWCKFFACDILVSTDIRIAQAAFKSSKLAWLLFLLSVLLLEIKYCLSSWVCYLIKFLRYSWLTQSYIDHDVSYGVTDWFETRSYIAISFSMSSKLLKRTVKRLSYSKIFIEE